MSLIKVFYNLLSVFGNGFADVIVQAIVLCLFMLVRCNVQDEVYSCNIFLLLYVAGRLQGGIHLCVWLMWYQFWRLVNIPTITCQWYSFPLCNMSHNCFRLVKFNRSVLDSDSCQKIVSAQWFLNDMPVFNDFCLIDHIVDVTLALLLMTLCIVHLVLLY